MLILKQETLAIMNLIEIQSGCEKMINKKQKAKSIMEKSDLLLIVLIAITMGIIFFSERNLIGVLLILLIIVLPGSCLLYWWDFRKQNK